MKKDRYIEVSREFEEDARDLGLSPLDYSNIAFAMLQTYVKRRREGNGFLAYISAPGETATLLDPFLKILPIASKRLETGLRKYSSKLLLTAPKSVEGFLKLAGVDTETISQTLKELEDLGVDTNL